jgi:uncharacterized membrane protein
MLRIEGIMVATADEVQNLLVLCSIPSVSVQIHQYRLLLSVTVGLVCVTAVS